ncbi:GLPGLI family protein [Sediminibacterium roseum]|uniref:GLPGLI family protein n=1 Tax=Sediminibacterium roseum TaxID=1978412 RepID=A0ABW9ZST2_9BACT|nr:GLPGLI family protein [Sediminibacterium roseum]NCI49492.1 GLPGLI family protein [Sediminibacterium roseum]
MRRIILLFLIDLCVGVPLSHAQSDSVFATVEYAFSHIDDTTQLTFPKKGKMKLYLAKKMSLYIDYDRMNGALAQATRFPNAQPIDEWKRYSLTDSYTKNFDTDQLIFIAPAGLSTYSIAEKIPVIDWVISQDTRTIKGFACQKASCTFRGRTYEAWFCSQIPYSNGPWKLGGLPGLILEAYDVNKDVTFTFVGFENGTDHAVIEMPTGFEKKTAKEYRQYREALNRDTNAMLGASTAGGAVMGRSSAGGPARRIKILNNPLEKTDN